MTKEELLIPRWEVIANYPGTYYEVGDIISDDGIRHAENQRGETVFVSKWGDYPNIFKRLQWHDYISSELLPKYVKIIADDIDTRIRLFQDAGLFCEVNKWVKEKRDNGEEATLAYINGYTPSWRTNEEEFGRLHICYLEPATEEEYLNYINSKSEK